jgi:nucleoside-diphosphate-sugar epimerase
VRNVVDANLLAAGADGVSGKALNIACGERISLNEIVQELRGLTGRDIEHVHAQPRPGDVRHSLADISRARETLGYEPAVDARAGLQATLEYHETRRREDRVALSIPAPEQGCRGSEIPSAAAP